ncbi:neuroendocrine convertase 2 [Fundulus heteroclitus]|uniref:neuroendocrine convertase 2 n=1 Tax=Fundulus heteroclitus TaxID=8078 RepID=UPI00165AE04A|nr:neuroendocrine convertase 2 [Fundulus heteroclitus]
MFSASLLVCCFLLQRNVATTEGHHGTNRHVFYAVQMKGGAKAARALAEQHGLQFIQRVGSLEGLYTLRDSRGRPDRVAFERRLVTAAGVLWVQRQHSHYRDKRVPLMGPHYDLIKSSQRKRSTADSPSEERKEAQTLTFNDPLWPMQWELFAQGEYSSGGFDLNVMPVWRNNITGKGVVVSIIDDARARYPIRQRFGFGVLDAGLMVQQAVLLRTAAPQRKCKQEETFYSDRFIPAGGQVSINIESDGCQGRANEINTLEHVQVRVRITAACRGDLSISLESPGGTVSLLLDTRPYDASAAGLKNWTMMTVHCWGEQARGLWTLKVTDHKGTVWSCARPSEEEVAGALLSATLILYGTYHPHRTRLEVPLQSIVSMGWRHPVPHGGLYRRDSSPPLDLIQWVYQMERDRKVQADDITLPAKHKILETTGDRVTNMSLIKPPASRRALKLHPVDVLRLSPLRPGSAPKMKTRPKGRRWSDGAGPYHRKSQRSSP